MQAASSAFQISHTPGGYQLELRGPNFRVEQRRLELRSGESLQLTIKLTIQTAGLEVTVVEGAGDPGSLNVAQTQFSKGLIFVTPRSIHGEITIHF
jgi:hypothetical protein